MKRSPAKLAALFRSATATSSRQPLSRQCVDSSRRIPSFGRILSPSEYIYPRLHIVNDTGLNFKARFFSTTNSAARNKQTREDRRAELFPEHSIFSRQGSDVLARLLAEHDSQISRLYHAVTDEGQPMEPNEISELSIEVEKFRERADAFRRQQELLSRWRDTVLELENLSSKGSQMTAEDREMKLLYKEELEDLEESLEAAEDAIAKLLLTEECEIDTKDCILEVKAGVGGLEAALFARELYDAYEMFCERNGWSFKRLVFF